MSAAAGGALSSVKTPGLSDKELTDIAPLRYFTDLEALFLRNKKISVLSPLQVLAKLTDTNKNRAAFPFLSCLPQAALYKVHWERAGKASGRLPKIH